MNLIRHLQTFMVSALLLGMGMTSQQAYALDTSTHDTSNCQDPELARVLDQQRTVAFFLIGGSTNNNARRNIGFGVAENGWEAFADRYIKPYFDDVCVKRFQLHNPFGTLPDEHMQLDQLIEARRAAHSNEDNGYDKEALKRVTDLLAFRRAFKPYIDRGAEITYYVGDPRHDPDFNRLAERHGKATAFHYAFKSLEPAITLGMTIGLDAAAGADENSLTYEFVRYLEKHYNARVLIEARPGIAKEHWYPYSFIVTNRVWDHVGAHNPDVWHHPNAEITHPHLYYHEGEEFRVMMLQRMGDGSIDYEIEQARRIMQEHENVALAFHGLNSFDAGRLNKIEYLRLVYADYLPSARSRLDINKDGNVTSEDVKSYIFLYENKNKKADLTFPHDKVDEKDLKLFKQIYAYSKAP